MTNHEENFLEFHQANPHVYALFKKYCNAAMKSGRKYYSVSSIFERIRWYQDIETKDDLSFKLNNNHKPYYARLYQSQYPNNRNFFRTREMTTHRPTLMTLFTDREAHHVFDL